MLRYRNTPKTVENTGVKARIWYNVCTREISVIGEKPCIYTSQEPQMYKKNRNEQFALKNFNPKIAIKS